MASDTSRYYHRVVDYADPTKKGSAVSNEVRANMEGMMTSAGFDVATLDINMMGQNFQTEDDLVNDVLRNLRINPGVSPNDYVGIALNSFTPVSVETHRYTSKVTYRIVRIKDGMALLPAKDITGDSGDNAASDDVGRSYAVKSALYKVDEILPREIKQAMTKMGRAEQREASQAAMYYTIQVINAAPTASLPIRNALTTAGFPTASVNRAYNGGAKSDMLTVTLNGKSGQDVMNAIEATLDKFDVLQFDDKITQVRVK